MNEGQSSKKKRKVNPFVRYTGMALQMMVPIAVGAWAGVQLDKDSTGEIPVWTVVLSLVGVAIALYLVIRSVNQLSNEE